MTATLTSQIRYGQPAARTALDPRPQLQDQLAGLESRGRIAASAGDLEESAKAILAALDCERRLAGGGLQVLQVIKPRR